MPTVRLSSVGRVSWTAEAPGAGADQTGGELIALGPTGAVYVAGEIGAEAYVTDVLLVRYTKGGALSWRDEWDASGTDTGRDQPKGLVVDRFGNAFVAGCFNEAAPNPANGFVARWRPDRIRWERAYACVGRRGVLRHGGLAGQGPLPGRRHARLGQHGGGGAGAAAAEVGGRRESRVAVGSLGVRGVSPGARPA